MEDRDGISKNYQHQSNRGWCHLGILMVWVILGLVLRFANLGAKSPSSIEIATLGYSLGHSFFDIPLEQVITLKQLLLPLQFEAATNPGDVINYLMSESTHPPLYFLLTHFWLKIFSHEGELVSLAAGRSLSAIFGVVAIPGMFGLGCLAFRSPIVGQIAAALMAVSPYGVYLAQEARHYTLTIAWIIASLSCLVVAIRCIQRHTPYPIWLGCFWVIVNSLGIASHYFFSLVLLAQGLVIAVFWLRNLDKASQKYWWRIYAVGVGTLVGCLVWFPALQGISGNEITDWIATSFELDEIWHPLPRLLVWAITMVLLLPVEGVTTPVQVIFAGIMLLVLLWLIPILRSGWKHQISSSALTSLSLQAIRGYLLATFLIFLFLIYFVGKDLSLAARYHFVYFPALIVLVAAIFAAHWHNYLVRVVQGKRIVIIILILGFCGALTVVNNYGYQKSQRSDLLASLIQNSSTAPALIATSYETHSEIRALMGLGFVFQHLQQVANFTEPQFLLLKKKSDRSVPQDSTLGKILTQIPRPMELWGVNLKVDSNDLDDFNCLEDGDSRTKVSGYRYRLYHCR